MPCDAPDHAMKTNPLDQELANYGTWVPFGPLLDFVNKVLLEYTWSLVYILSIAAFVPQ